MTLLDPMHVQVTKDFINENPIVVRPGRRTRVPTGSGGYTLSDPVLQSPQTVRKVGIGLVTGTAERTTASGETVTITGHLIGLPNANIQINDVIQIGAATYTVLTLSFDPPWRLQAEVYQRG